MRSAAGYPAKHLPSGSGGTCGPRWYGTTNPCILRVGSE